MGFYYWLKLKSSNLISCSSISNEDCYSIINRFNTFFLKGRFNTVSVVMKRESVKALEISEVEVLSKSIVNELEVRCNLSVDVTWNPATQYVSLAGELISRRTPPTLKSDRRWEINEWTINWMQEYWYQDIGCLYFGGLMKKIMSRDFGRVSIWYFFSGR